MSCCGLYNCTCKSYWFWGYWSIICTYTAPHTKVQNLATDTHLTKQQFGSLRRRASSLLSKPIRSIWLTCAFHAWTHTQTTEFLSSRSSTSTVFFLQIGLALHLTGTVVAQWLRCCATNWKVIGSIPAGVIGIFHWHKIFPIAIWPWGRLSL